MSENHERICLCALNMLFGFEPRIALALLEGMESAAAVFSLKREDLRSLLGPYNPALDKITPDVLELAEKELEETSRRGARFITIKDKGYPDGLKECVDAPIGLYFLSNFKPETVFHGRPSVSIVGTRNQSPYGKQMCTELVQSLSTLQHSPLIASGLAMGVDITAHVAALDSGLPTVAVLPVGIDSVYPRQHEYVADRIASTPGCALISDYPLRTPPLRPYFLRRNRIIAGLSRATVLVESKIKGGGMMTARLAASYDRDVFAFPGKMDDVLSQGCNLLIRQRLADPLIDFGDFAESIGLGSISPMNLVDIDQEIGRLCEGSCKDHIDNLKKIARCIKSQRGISIEGICEKTGMSYPEVSSLAGILCKDAIIDIDLFQRCTINLKKN